MNAGAVKVTMEEKARKSAQIWLKNQFLDAWRTKIGCEIKIDSAVKYKNEQKFEMHVKICKKSRIRHKEKLVLKRHKFTIVYFGMVLLFTTYIFLDSFVFNKTVYEHKNSKELMEESGTIFSTADEYVDNNISIKIKKLREFDSNIYAADVEICNDSLIKTAFAKDQYGKNMVEKTSDLSKRKNAILSINGDSYGMKDANIIIRDGIIYRNKPEDGIEDLLIYSNGDFAIGNESEDAADKWIKSGVVTALSCGPTVLKGGKNVVEIEGKTANELSRNPRTAIGQIDSLHYIFLVCDGRTPESEGLTMYELGEVLKKLKVETAYNLDGLGKSTMYFNGAIVNNPTINGTEIRERSVSDIVYIGY